MFNKLSWFIIAIIFAGALGISTYYYVQYQKVAADTSGKPSETSVKVGIDYDKGQEASATLTGFLTSDDWTKFNNKQDALVFNADDFKVTDNYVSIDYSNAPTAGALSNGFLLASDWNTFNNKIDLAGLSSSGLIIPTTVEETNWNNAFASGHVPLTIGTANGLSLSTQQLSLGLASNGVTGALSGTNWNTFNDKQGALSFGNVTAGTSKITIGGTGVGAVIGAGLSIDVAEGNLNHNNLSGLTTGDPHTQYALLIGRSGGQSISGGTNANDDITIQGTTNATRTTSYVNLQPNGGNVGIGTASPSDKLSVTADNKYTSVHQIYSMGDSLTEDGTYISKMENLLGSSWNINNKGIWGQNTTQMLARFTTDVITPGNAEYVIVWAGVNDIGGGATASTIESNLQAMYDMAHNAGIKVVAVNIAPFNPACTAWPGGCPQAFSTLDTVNTWIASSARNVDYRIDEYSVVVDPSNPYTLLPAYSAPGGLHMITAGYEAVGTTIYNNATWSPILGNALNINGDSVIFGKVGIGISNPLSRLDVNGGIAVGSYAGVNIAPANGLITSGNVGIGTTAPNYKLDVAGSANISAGSAYKYNGANVITANTTLFNYFFGNAGNLTMTGASNTAVGSFALISNTTGTSNTAVGSSALQYNTEGNYNTAIGRGALITNTTGSNNTANGNNALSANTTGSSNTANGLNALLSNTTGSGNTASGESALSINKTGSNNTANGFNALLFNTVGTSNTAVGYNTLFLNTTGISNTAIGTSALSSNTTGFSNTAVGFNALSSLRPTSKAITAFADYGGTVAGTIKATSAGHGIVGAGVRSIYGTTSYNSSYFVTVIDANSFYFTAAWAGTQTGWWAIASEGRYNTVNGYNAGNSIVTGSSNTFLGYAAGFNASQLNSAVNSMALGANTYTTVNNQTVIGDGSTNVGIGFFTAPTARLHLPAGTATAGSSPLKFTTGTLLATEEAGAIEFSTDTFYMTATNGVAGSTKRQAIPGVTTGTAAPATTPIRVGDIYTDTNNKKVYISTGTASSADWTILN